MTTDNREQNYEILPERPPHFLVSHKALWGASILGLAVCVFLVFGTGHPLITALLIIALVLFFFAGVAPSVFDGGSTTPLAKAFRHGNHGARNLVGVNKDVSEVDLEGEVFYRAVGVKPRKPFKIHQIGRVEFIPYKMPSGSNLGVAYDHRENTYSATIWIASSSQLGDGEYSKIDRLAGYAALLDTMAESDSPLHRFSWCEQTLLGEHQQPEQLVAVIRDGAQLDRKDPPNQDKLLSHVAQLGKSSILHRTTMTLTMRPNSLVKRLAKAHGGGRDGMIEVLVDTLKDFYTEITGTDTGNQIGIKAASFLSYNDLIIENRLRLDPVYGQPLWEEWYDPQDQRLLDENLAWPGFANFEPEAYCQLGDTIHTGFHVSQLTRIGRTMPPDQLWKIIRIPVPKAVTAVVDMVPFDKAQGRAEMATTGAVSAQVDRREYNMIETAQQGVNTSKTRTHEAELAENLGQAGRIRVYIDLTGKDRDEVNASSAKLRSAVMDARFRLETLVGRQYHGIDAVMPIGRGLKTYRQ